jgi:Uma2 family endonuclease
VQLTEPKSRLWSKAEYYRMAELGWFEGQRVELIEGEVVVQSPQSASHFGGTDRVADVLRAAFGREFWIRMQGPLDLGSRTETEPDVTVVANSSRSSGAHPTSAILVVEVSESSLSYDRNRKASLYARSGMADYWIVNLVDRHLEVRRDPVPDEGQPFGFRYRDVAVLKPGDLVAPLAFPAIRIPVADLIG